MNYKIRFGNPIYPYKVITKEYNITDIAITSNDGYVNEHEKEYIRKALSRSVFDKPIIVDHQMVTICKIQSAA